MHMSLRIGDQTIMASDGRCEGGPTFQGFALSLNVTDTSEADRLFGVFSDCGQVQMPLTETSFHHGSEWSPIGLAYHG